MSRRIPLRDSFAARVIAWQRRCGRRDLPWQNTRDAYRIWLSEVMLQQTQVATVLPYFTRLVSEFPTVGALAAAPLSRVLELWSGLGYYRRAHHLHAAARTVADRHAGRFPSDAATLATLPGIGRSTAAAIAAFAGDERGAILDGNVKRVLARHRGIDGWPGAPRVEAGLWRVAEALLPDAANGASNAIAAYTQGMMDIGATICTRSRPHCDACPVNDDCIARRDGRVDSLPSPRPRKALPQRSVAVLLLERNG
ncbi:MAG: A/G-specific adenine glycosylase, partial [Burkholderiales bacterium]